MGGGGGGGGVGGGWGERHERGPKPTQAGLRSLGLDLFQHSIIPKKPGEGCGVKLTSLQSCSSKATWVGAHPASEVVLPRIGDPKKRGVLNRRGRLSHALSRACSERHTSSCPNKGVIFS